MSSKGASSLLNVFKWSRKTQQKKFAHVKYCLFTFTIIYLYPKFHFQRSKTLILYRVFLSKSFAVVWTEACQMRLRHCLPLSRLVSVGTRQLHPAFTCVL